MNNKYVELFDILIKSYYNGNFDETLNKIITCHEKSPQETFAIITSLCGVDIKFDNNYVYNLKKAITEYNVNKKIVEKLECSNSNCKPSKENKHSDRPPDPKRGPGGLFFLIVNLIKIILIAAKELVLFMQ